MADEDEGISTELIIFPFSDKNLSIICDEDALSMAFVGFGIALIDAIPVLEYLYVHINKFIMGYQYMMSVIEGGGWRAGHMIIIVNNEY